MNDLRFALRTLRKSPGFAAAAILTLALGIGANAAVWSLLQGLVMRPLPGIPEVERVVEVAARGVSQPLFRDARDEVPHFSGLAAYRNRQLALRADGRTSLITALVISGNYFDVLRAGVVVGRPITEADDRPAASTVAVISHGLWRRHFGGDPDVLGRTLALNDAPVTIVGVAAPEVRGTRVLYSPDLWIPIAHWPVVAPSAFEGVDIERRTYSWLTLVGRLAPGASLEQAQEAMDAFADRQREVYPDETSTQLSLALTPATRAATGLGLRDAVVGFLGLLSAVVAIVLLIACANIANLLLARAAGRRRELAMRRALGASRGRLARQLLGETALLAGLGAALGLALAFGGLLLVTRIELPAGATLAGVALGPEWRMLGVSAALALVATFVAGLVPAWQAAGTRAAGGLTGAVGEAPGRLRARQAFLVAQVALCLVLLVGAGLFLRSLERAFAADLGFRPEGLALVAAHPGLARHGPDQAGAYQREALAAARSLPGVRSASWVHLVPLTADVSSETFAVAGYEPAADEHLEAELNAVGPGYFRTLGIPILRGREIEARDDADAPIVALVNRTFAERYFAGREAVGGRLDLFVGEATVIGVVADHVYHRLGETPQPYIYTALAQQLAGAGRSEITLVARTDGEPAALLGPIAEALTRVDQRVPVTGQASGPDLYAELLMPQRLGSRLLGAFGALGLLLAVVGIYGVVAYSVGQQTREIGVRMALGASSTGVLRLFVGRGITPALLGVVLGVVPALAATRLLEPFLYQVGPVDPLTLAGAAALLLTAAAVAALLPARRAARIDPMEALRHE